MEWALEKCESVTVTVEPAGLVAQLMKMFIF